MSPNLYHPIAIFLLCTPSLWAYDNAELRDFCAQQASSETQMCASGMKPSPLSDVQLVNDKLADDEYRQTLLQTVNESIRSQVLWAETGKSCFSKELKELQPPSPSAPGGSGQAVPARDSASCKNPEFVSEELRKKGQTTCCDHIIEDMRKGLARQAFAERTYRALARLKLPDYEHAKSGGALGAMEVELYQQAGKYPQPILSSGPGPQDQLSADEFLYVRERLRDFTDELKIEAQQQNKKDYSAKAERITAANKKVANDYESDEVITLQPPDYKVSAELGARIYSQSHQKMVAAAAMLEMDSSKPESLNRLCAVRKFTNLALTAVKAGTQKNKDNRFCRAALRLEDKCRTPSIQTITSINPRKLFMI